MKRIAFYTLTLFFLLTVSTYGQTDCFQTDDRLEKQRCEEFNRISNKVFHQTRFTEPDKNLVPAASGAWLLHVVTTGGINGLGRPTVTIISNGQFACGENENLQFNPFVASSQFKPLISDSFESLSEMIGSTEFKIDKSKDKSTDKSISDFCNDCYQTSILLARRNSNGKIKTFTNSLKFTKYPRFATLFSKIKNQAFDLTDCK